MTGEEEEEEAEVEEEEEALEDEESEREFRRIGKEVDGEDEDEGREGSNMVASTKEIGRPNA